MPDSQPLGIYQRANQPIFTQVFATAINVPMVSRISALGVRTGRLYELERSYDTDGTGDLTAQQFFFGPRQFPENVWIVSAMVALQTGDFKRGEIFTRMSADGGYPLLQDYVYRGHASLLGSQVDGTSGKGFLHWVQEGNDVSGNVVTTVNLAQTSLLRMVRAVLIKYEQTGGATATITIALRDMASDTVPTNFTIDGDTWISPNLVLAAGEQGMMHVGEHGFLSVNDNGTLSYADNTTAPNPFPLMVDDQETGDLLIAASAGASGDDYDVWVQYEDWIEL